MAGYGRAPGGRSQRLDQAGSPWRWGAMAGWMGVFIVAVATMLGIIGTLLAKRDPGTALGVLVIIGTIAAGFAVRPRASYVIVPVPALAYVFGALATGYVHDKAADTSHTALVFNAAQWVASGFTTMAVATLAALVIAVARWALDSRGAWSSRAGGSARSEPRTGYAAGSGRGRDTGYGHPAYNDGQAYPPSQGPGQGTARSYPPDGGQAKGGRQPTGQEPDPYAGYYDDGGTWR
jgi:hypothetical protein